MLTTRDFTPCGSTALTSPSRSLPRHSLFSLAGRSRRRFSCSLRVEELSTSEDRFEASHGRVRLSDVLQLTRENEDDVFLREEEEKIKEEEEKKRDEEEEKEEEEEEKGISKIRVSRQKYIPVSKAELLDAIVLKLFHSQDDDDVSQFRLLSSCLDSILHAEHKCVLEEMRNDYGLIHSVGNKEKGGDGFYGSDGKGADEGKENADSDGGGGFDGIESFGGGFEGEGTMIDERLDLWKLLWSSVDNGKIYSSDMNRLAVATRFQRAFMQLLDNAQFQELSARDLTLTSALNSDYLLTLPIYVDWKKASESNAIIFRRGYETEREKGLLIGEKLDYLQSRLLQKVFTLLSEPFGKIGQWIKEAIRNAGQTQEVQDSVKRVTQELSLFQQSYLRNDQAPENILRIDQLSDRELPIWLAAQKAVSRYEGFLSPVGPRGRLFRRFLACVGLASPMPETPFEVDNDDFASEPHLRPISLSRISLSDIWRPATRKYCGNNLWKMLKTSFSILLSQSILQEPAFQELILLYTEEASESDSKDKAEVPSLQLKIYERIPIPDLPVVFPHKKLSFRIIDTVRLDVATIVGLLAYFINYKFEDILSSPSAIFLDVIAATALIIYVTRVALGYKQTWDRYQLLVNKTLYEKTLASGFGSVHFLLDASEQQQYKEAILTYAILLKVRKGQVNCHQSLGQECERFLYDVFKVKVEMPIGKALNTLERLGLVTNTPGDTRIRTQAIPCGMAHEALKERWNSLLCQ